MRFTDGLAAGVFDASARLELRLPVTWECVGTTVRARMGLHNAHALPLILHAQVLIHKPWRITVFLMLYDVHLRRLDVNGSHRNRTGVREAWVERTHKHRWSEAQADADAYTPGDIPSIPLTSVTGDHYRQVVEAFCGECGIALAGGYRWSAPDLNSSDDALGQGG